MAQKPAKMNSKGGASGVEGPNKAGAAAAGENAAASGAPATGQAAPMSVTLGGQQQNRARPAGAAADATMQDPLADAARNDGPRSSIPGPIPDMNRVVEALDVIGEIPQARFGHTITIVCKNKVVLFGGATGDTGKYSMTGETFMYNILNKSWQKLTGKSAIINYSAVEKTLIINAVFIHFL